MPLSWSWLRLDLEYGPVVGNSAPDGRPIESSGCAQDQASLRENPVRAVVVKVIQNLLVPTPARRRMQLERRPASGAATSRSSAAGGGRAVEIAGTVEDQAAAGIGTVSRADAAEGIDHTPSPAPTRCALQLEHRAVAVSAAATLKGHAV